MSLTREDVLGADDLKREPVDAPEWGGTVWVQELSAADAMEYDVWIFENKEDRASIMKGMNAMMVMLCACNEEGERLFSNTDLAEINSKAPEPVARIARAAFSINKMRDSDYEDEVKNSESGQTVASITG